MLCVEWVPARRYCLLHLLLTQKHFTLWTFPHKSDCPEIFSIYSQAQARTFYVELASFLWKKNFPFIFVVYLALPRCSGILSQCRNADISSYNSGGPGLDPDQLGRSLKIIKCTGRLREWKFFCHAQTWTPWKFRVGIPFSLGKVQFEKQNS